MALPAEDGVNVTIHRNEGQAKLRSLGWKRRGQMGWLGPDGQGPMSLRDALEDVFALERKHTVAVHLVQTEQLRRDAVDARNAPCRCGSGRKFKRCCLKGKS